MRRTGHLSSDAMRAAELELDLDVFAGPFDLLMTLVLREELSLAEVELGRGRGRLRRAPRGAGELDLEAATEFLVLIASLLELKSRLMLPAAEEEEIELGPEEAADELLARMLEYRRYRDAAADLRGLRGRAALPVPARRRCRRRCGGSRWRRPGPPTRPSSSASRSATCCGFRPRRTRATSARRSRSRSGWWCCAGCLAADAGFDFDELFGDEDRLTQAVTLFALLEMYKRGEASWSQSETFGPIQVEAQA